MRADINEEEGLLKLLKGRSEAAFTRIYQLYVRQLYAKTLKMVHDSYTAQEIIQDIFLKIWKKGRKLILKNHSKLTCILLLLTLFMTISESWQKMPHCKIAYFWQPGKTTPARKI